VLCAGVQGGHKRSVQALRECSNGRLLQLLLLLLLLLLLCAHQQAAVGLVN
jgi:hypothetical protein